MTGASGIGWDVCNICTSSACGWRLCEACQRDEQQRLAAEQPETVEVMQADRDAAHAFVNTYGWLCEDAWLDLLAGDQQVIAEAFARHRLTSRPTPAGASMPDDLCDRCAEYVKDCTCASMPGDAVVRALAWFSTDQRLSLAHYHPVYGDDDDQTEEWRVERENGSVNDREWTVIGRGETAKSALIEAFATNASEVKS